MAMSNAEKVQRYRNRLKAAKNAAPDLTADFIKKPLSKFQSSHYVTDEPGTFEFAQGFTHIGFDFPNGFFDEIAVYPANGTGSSSMSGRSLLERMEALAGAFLDGATELFATINEFKLSEIDARIAEIERADLSAPDAKAKALQDIVTLRGIKGQLEGKTFRRSFAEIAVKDTVPK